MNNTIDPVSGYPSSLTVSNDKGRSAVSWGAIAAGAVVAAKHGRPGAAVVKVQDFATSILDW